MRKIHDMELIFTDKNPDLYFANTDSSSVKEFHLPDALKSVDVIRPIEATLNLTCKNALNDK